MSRKFGILAVSQTYGSPWPFIYMPNFSNISETVGHTENSILGLIETVLYYGSIWLKIGTIKGF
jgi:hypothetical protein